MDEPDLSGKRVACVECMDTGLVEVFNPEFVASFRSRFEAMAGVYPPGWLHEARMWWFQFNVGAMIFSAMCECDCQRVLTMRREVALFNSGERKNPATGKAIGPPACGRYRWKRSETPRVKDRFDAVLNTGERTHGPARVLADFYNAQLF